MTHMTENEIQDRMPMFTKLLYRDAKVLVRDVDDKSANYLNSVLTMVSTSYSWCFYGMLLTCIAILLSAAYFCTSAMSPTAKPI